jgi:hypothetical protein
MKYILKGGEKIMLKLFKKLTTQWFWGVYTHVTYYSNGRKKS